MRTRDRGRGKRKDGGPSIGRGSEASMAIAAEDENSAALDTEPEPAIGRVVMSAVEEEPVPAPSLINVVGMFFWGLFDLFQVIEALPPFRLEVL